MGCAMAKATCSVCGAEYGSCAHRKGVTYDGVFYQGVDWLSWVLLFHIPMFCLPCSAICFKEYRKLKNAAK